MTGINHALTGTLIVYSISNPVLGLSLAFLSHLALDSLPHYGDKGRITDLTKLMWAVDLVLVPSLVLFLFFSSISNNLLLITGLVLAVSPDFAWVYRILYLGKFRKIEAKSMNAFNRFHAKIQKYEFEKGICIEIAVTIVLSIVFFSVVA